MSRSVEGRWRSTTSGGLLHLFAEEGQLRGTYQTPLGRSDAEESYPLTGCVVGGALSFCVAWSKQNSLTSWTGYLVDGELHLFWHLADCSPELTFSHTLTTGFVRFTRAPEPAE